MPQPPPPLPMAGNAFNPRTVLIGCVAVLGIFAVVGAGTMAGLFFMVKSAVEGMTEDAPRPLPAVALDAETLDALRARVEDFAQGRGGPALLLDANDLNGLIAIAGDRGPLDWLRVEIEDDRVFGQISLPLRRLGAEGFGLGDRYLNGRVALDVRFDQGYLNVFIQDIQVKDKPVPGDILDAISQQNLARELAVDGKSPGEWLKDVERIEIRDGRVKLLRRGAASTV